MELDLFCPFYTDEQWAISPMNAVNNVNGIGDVDRQDVYTPKGRGGLLEVQEAMTREIVTALRDHDNLYYEICNEPYARDIPLAWEHRIADVLTEAEADFPHRHLIARNVSNGSARVDDPHPAISVFNFHYASPPTAVAENAHLNRPIGDNETGFRGTDAAHYRMEAWEFILAGGALYNNLDYSFAVGHEDGSFEYPDSQPGSGSPELREQLRILKDFIHGFGFLAMSPDVDVAVGVSDADARATVLSAPGAAYAAYVFGGPSVTLTLALPPGRYDVTWIDTRNGGTDKRERVQSDGTVALDSPVYDAEVALRIVRAAT